MNLETIGIILVFGVTIIIILSALIFFTYMVYDGIMDEEWRKVFIFSLGIIFLIGMILIGIGRFF